MFLCWIAADNKSMVSQKDYQDYSRYVNDQNKEKKENLLNQTAQRASTAQAKHKRSATQDFIDPLIYKTQSNFFNKKRTDKRTASIDHSITNGEKVDFSGTQVKPKIIESKVSNKEDFFNLSDGFKKIFGNDKKDQKMVIPVCGYGGHRRGDRSQNFFGKSFRDITIQSKNVERQFRSNSLAEH